MRSRSPRSRLDTRTRTGSSSVPSRNGSAYRTFQYRLQLREMVALIQPSQPGRLLVHLQGSLGIVSDKSARRMEHVRSLGQNGTQPIAQAFELPHIGAH